ncbi:MAG TPA: serine--tRNA ligase, partial [Pseudobdellovibrionaceae bacterium]
MIDIKLLEKKAENGVSYFDEYKQSLVNRGASTEVLEQIIELNKKRKEMITSAESEKAKQNKLSGEIGKLKREGGDTSALMAEVEKLKGLVKDLELKATEIDQQVTHVALTLPNKLHSSVPVGHSEKENLQVKLVGTPPKFSFKSKEHWEIGEALDIIDFERAAKTTGTRFAFLKGAAAQLERCLIQFMMDLHSQKHGYTEMIPPFMVNSDSLLGTGQFPKFKEDVFNLTGTDLYLIPTAEVPVTNYYNNEILNETDLPKSFCAYS